MSKMIKVLVVDDSPVFRALLTQLIASDPDLEVVGSAEDPYQARDMIKRLNPDVLTLDIEMPKMNGVQFLRNLMRLRPMPVVMISTLTQHGADATLAALEAGAVDYFPKPSVDNTADMVNYKTLVNEKLKMAAGANVANSPKPSAKAPVTITPCSTRIQLLAIGASTGGTEALNSVLSALPAGLPPIVITQHISAQFTPSLAKRLNANSAVEVEEVKQRQVSLQSGHAYLAPGDQHMVVTRRGAELYALLDDRDPVNRHKPSVDVMFDSVAEVLADKALAMLLTGMGQDGAKGMLKMRQKGAATVAQDERSCVVWGMPRVAIELGAAKDVRALSAMPQWIGEHIHLNKNNR